jgi:hypothetical protein
MKRALPVLLSCALLASCSRFVVKRPPPYATAQVAADEWIPCTDVYFGPVIDTALVAGAITFMAFTAAQNDELGLILGGVLLVPLGVGAGISAVRGASSVKECRGLHSIYEQTPATLPTTAPTSSSSL